MYRVILAGHKPVQLLLPTGFLIVGRGRTQGVDREGPEVGLPDAHLREGELRDRYREHSPSERPAVRRRLREVRQRIRDLRERRLCTVGSSRTAEPLLEVVVPVHLRIPVRRQQLGNAFARRRISLDRAVDRSIDPNK